MTHFSVLGERKGDVINDKKLEFVHDMWKKGVQYRISSQISSKNLYSTHRIDIGGCDIVLGFAIVFEFKGKPSSKPVQNQFKTTSKLV